MGNLWETIGRTLTRRAGGGRGGYGFWLLELEAGSAGGAGCERGAALDRGCQPGDEARRTEGSDHGGRSARATFARPKEVRAERL